MSDELKLKVAQLEGDLEEAYRDVATLIKECDELKAEVRRRHKLTKERDEAQAEVERLNNEVIDLKQEILRLLSEINAPAVERRQADKDSGRDALELEGWSLRHKNDKLTKERDAALEALRKLKEAMEDGLGLPRGFMEGGQR